MERLTPLGRQVRLPSTIEIKRELRMISAADDLPDALRGEACTPVEMSAIIERLTATYGISPDRARMLVERVGHGRERLDAAARGLRARKVGYDVA